MIEEVKQKTYRIPTIEEFIPGFIYEKETVKNKQVLEFDADFQAVVLEQSALVYKQFIVPEFDKELSCFIGVDCDINGTTAQYFNTVFNSNLKKDFLNQIRKDLENNKLRCEWQM